MSQPRKILLAACLALALIFGSDLNIQAVSIDDTLSIEAALKRCNADTELAQLTIEGCFQGLRFVSADFPHRNRQFKDLAACLSAMKSLDVHSLLERQFQRCDREWTHIYFRRGCKDAAIAYYSSLDPETFCTRGGVGAAPVMPLPPDPGTMQSREPEFQFVLSQPLLPPMTPLFQKPVAASAPGARPAGEPVAGKSKTERKKPAQPSPAATASPKLTAKPADKAVTPEVAKRQTPEKRESGNAFTDVKKPSGMQEQKTAVTIPAGELSAPRAQNDTPAAPVPDAPAKPAQSAPVDNAGFISATNVTGNLLQEQTESIAVPFKPSVPAALDQQVPVLPEAPVIPLIPAGQIPNAATQETKPALPPPNQFVYQNKNAQQPASLRDIPLGVPNKPVEGLSGAPQAGNIDSPALPQLPQSGPQPSIASQGSASASPTPLPLSVSNTPSPATAGPPASAAGTVPPDNPDASTVTPGSAPANIAPIPSPAAGATLATLPAPPPMTAMPSTTGAQQPGMFPLAGMPGFATPGMAPQPQTSPPALPGFFSSPEQTQIQSKFTGNDEAVNNGQPAAMVSAGDTAGSAANTPPGPHTPPPSQPAPFSEDPR